MTTFAPMLAHSAPATDETIQRLQGSHFFDLKVDGVRAIMIIAGGAAKLINRNGVTITNRYPEIVKAALACFGLNSRLILDGEIAVLDSDGRPSFRLTSKRDRQHKLVTIEGLSRTLPATFIAFDLLYRASGPAADRRARPWSARHDELTELLNHVPPSARIRLNVGGHDGSQMLELVRQYGLEGLVAKRLDSPYQSGRRATWVKIKPTVTGSFLVTGVSRGSGSRTETFGALELSLTCEDDSLLRVGEVGSGFKQADLAEVIEYLLTGKDLIVEVEYQELTESGALRFPVFRGIRSDLLRADASHAQLGVSCAGFKSPWATSSTAVSLPASTSPTTTASAT